MPVISVQELQEKAPKLKGKSGERLIRAAMRFIALDKVNDLYDRHCEVQGPDFAAAILEDIGVDYRIGHAERLETLPEGPFITVSNHIYGHIDGIMLIDLFGHLRQEFKVMVNELLAHIKALSPNFINVVPKGDEELGLKATNLSGVRETLGQLQNGYPVGFFPSGAVSDLSLKEHCIRDREWQEPAIRIIQKARVPVIPVRFFDRNSMYYYLLGLISSSVRLMRLCGEVFNKCGKVIRMGIGEIITPEQQAACTTTEELSALLRRSVYEMPLPESFVCRSELQL